MCAAAPDSASCCTPRRAGMAPTACCCRSRPASTGIASRPSRSSRSAGSSPACSRTRASRPSSRDLAVLRRAELGPRAAWWMAARPDEPRARGARTQPRRGARPLEHVGDRSPVSGSRTGSACRTSCTCASSTRACRSRGRSGAGGCCARIASCACRRRSRRSSPDRPRLVVVYDGLPRRRRRARDRDARSRRARARPGQLRRRAARPDQRLEGTGRAGTRARRARAGTTGPWSA